MGLNFFGMHHYPERGEPSSIEGPEPHVWIGHKNDVNDDGTLNEEEPTPPIGRARFEHPRTAGVALPSKTTHFSDGAGRLFPYDEMASDAVGLKQPSTPAEKAAVINNVGFCCMTPLLMRKDWESRPLLALSHHWLSNPAMPSE